MATWRRDGRLTGGQRLLCAGVAGALSLSLTAPLELATVLAQVGAARGQARGPWAAGLRVWRAEGPRALWKGNAVACLRLFPCSAVQLAAYRKFVILFTDDLGHISQWSSIMAGSLAGMVSTIVMYPTDLIKTRLIVQNLLEPSYRGILHAFSTVYQQEGFLALYRGVSLTVLVAGRVPAIGHLHLLLPGHIQLETKPDVLVRLTPAPPGFPKERDHLPFTQWPKPEET
ncbi:solute carrier family 25 member 43-like isoform X2 [Lontra canadensis]|uniref:solute carrier family 25 member 43-like isoform X2 n=1 Tax=Lontra canadensis TaxID=76717 RepID=UPI0013F3786E|nr:solute carrier family 25 member 43-like isoform X2 [Lontra canadensis]